MFVHHNNKIGLVRGHDSEIVKYLMREQSIKKASFPSSIRIFIISLLLFIVKMLAEIGCEWKYVACVVFFISKISKNFVNFDMWELVIP
jgi:hypothetical protein